MRSARTRLAILEQELAPPKAIVLRKCCDGLCDECFIDPEEKACLFEPADNEELIRITFVQDWRDRR